MHPADDAPARPNGVSTLSTPSTNQTPAAEIQPTPDGPIRLERTKSGLGLLPYIGLMQVAGGILLFTSLSQDVPVFMYCAASSLALTGLWEIFHGLLRRFAQAVLWIQDGQLVRAFPDCLRGRRIDIANIQEVRLVRARFRRFVEIVPRDPNRFLDQQPFYLWPLKWKARALGGFVGLRIYPLEVDLEALHRELGVARARAYPF